jgi:hypothetical protein
MTSLTFKIELDDTDPKVTRSFKVSPNTTMYELHHTIQIVMGWTNSHIYQFTVGKQVIADTRLVDDELGPVTDVKGVMLADVFTEVGTVVMYEYDFGDGWDHHLELVDISTHTFDDALPKIIGGEYACPPEDCGGTYGYRELKEVLMSPKHPEYISTKLWVGPKFDPMLCDFKCIQKGLGKLKRLIHKYEEGFY